ncbi:MAG: hypothetical protein ACKVOW_06920 [Chitinophagaceae bacterium]
MKWLIVVILIKINLSLSAQATYRIPDQDRRWRSLNLSAIQKEQIRTIIKRQRMQHYLDWVTLNTVLNLEQKKKLKEWKKSRRKK